MDGPKDWDQLYLVGWYRLDGSPCVSAWELGDRTPVSVVVLGLRDPLPPHGEPVPPLRGSKVPEGVLFKVVPEGEQALPYARRLGGVFAFGFYIPEGFSRDP